MKIPKEEPKQGTISEAIKQVINNQLKQETVMENKTPIQEAIDRINSFEYVLHKKDVIEILTELLEKEKRVITGAYNQSTYQFANNAEVINPLSAQDYYNEKFNNNERTQIKG